MNINTIGIKNYIDYSNRIKLSFGCTKKETNSLERTPAKDKFILSTIDVKRKKFSQSDIDLISKGLESIKKEGLLSDEIVFLLEPKTDARGKKSFTPSQAIVIDAAVKKITQFKTLSKLLEKEAQTYGEECLAQMKQVFGGEEGLGKYIEARFKDSQGIYDKLVKEFKDNKVNSEMLDIISKRVYKLPIDELDKEDKELLKLAIKDGDVKLEPKEYRMFAEILKHNKKEYFESRNYIKDLVGTRLVLPEGNQKELKQVEKYLTKAITKGELQVTRVSNYHANHILPYIQHDVAKHWKQIVPGLRVVETNEVRKKNGYTTTQINVVHKVKTHKGMPKDILGEFQIRTRELNYIGNVEHLIYDILQNKNIGKNIPELNEYYDRIGIKKAVKEVFNDPKKEQAYFNYEKAMYYWVRNNETQTDEKRQYSKPRLHEYGLEKYWHLLSFDSLIRIDKTATEIKKKYKSNYKPEKK